MVIRQNGGVWLGDHTWDIGSRGKGGRQWTEVMEVIIKWG